MDRILRVALAMMAAAVLSGCAPGPVSAQRKAEAADVPQDHPHPPARLANAPLDGSMDKLYCYNDGPDTICHRQTAP